MGRDDVIGGGGGKAKVERIGKRCRRLQLPGKKGLSAEAIDRVVLTPGECLPHDRRFAIALGSTRFDPEHPEWLPKTHFIMLMRDETLAQLRTLFDAGRGFLAIAENDRVLLRAQITTAKGCELVAEFFTNFLGDGSQNRRTKARYAIAALAS